MIGDWIVFNSADDDTERPCFRVCSHCRRQCFGEPDRPIAVGPVLTADELKKIEATHTICVTCFEALYGPLDDNEPHHSIDPIAIQAGAA